MDEREYVAFEESSRQRTPHEVRLVWDSPSFWIREHGGAFRHAGPGPACTRSIRKRDPYHDGLWYPGQTGPHPDPAAHTHRSTSHC